MRKKNLLPVLARPSSKTPAPHDRNQPPPNTVPCMLPSFPSLRERNLNTLYPNSDNGSNGGGKSGKSDKSDKSPKGSVDEKIRPLVDLINLHPEYVTLSSCSGRVALFDPTGGCDLEEVDGDNGDNGDNEYDGETMDGRKNVDNDNEEIDPNLHDDEWNSQNDSGNHDTITESRSGQNKTKSTKISGKGRGKWIFVTHDILPDLGSRMIQSLQNVGQERHERRKMQLKTLENKTTMGENEITEITEDEVISEDAPITFKHEPPLLHVGASSLEAGRKLLHLAKSTCAMRESGMVVTDQRVTVELRTCSTLLCVPLMIKLSGVTPPETEFTNFESSNASFSLLPNEDYLRSLAGMANERMARNEMLLEKLFRAVESTLFEEGIEESVGDSSCSGDSVPKANGCSNNENDMNSIEYDVTLEPLPNLNLWKTAAVAIPHPGIGNNALDILAFGGQGIGPIAHDGGGKLPSCRRWDAVFRLARRNGVWSDKWDIVPVLSTLEMVDTKSADKHFQIEDGGSAEHESGVGVTFRNLITDAGMYRIQTVKGIGPREGHTACMLPLLEDKRVQTGSSSHLIAIFGGRTGGPMSPSNDLFIFVFDHFTKKNEKCGGIFGIPVDVRGEVPEPRYGHSAVAFPRSQQSNRGHDGEPLAVISGGVGVNSSSSSASFSSVYILSRIVDAETGYSHFLWERISNMPRPLFHHSTAIVSVENTHRLFVFGGVSEVDDPLCSMSSRQNQDGESPDCSWFQLPLFGEESDGSKSNTRGRTGFNLAPLIGSAAAAIPLLSSKPSVLLLGGVHPPGCFVGKQDEILSVVEWKVGGSQNLVGPTKLNILPSIQSSTENKIVNQPRENINFGACVHHCLVVLPEQKLPQNIEKDFTVNAVSVGGGVPSFSFGQTYARSFAMGIVRRRNGSISISKNANVTKKVLPTKNATNCKKSQIGKPESNSKLAEVEVLYFASSNAKKAKNSLESLQYLDKRYKMIKSTKIQNCSGSAIIAIPVTVSCTSYIKKKGNELSLPHDESKVSQCTYEFETLIVGQGTEKVPLSSSSLGKMKQKRDL